MRLKLNDKYRITSDRYNYILQEKKVASADNPLTKNVGKVNYINLAYFGALEHLVRYLVENEVKSDSIKDLIALNKRLDELEVSITKQIEKGLINHV